MGFAVITPPTDSPISLGDMKEHLRVEASVKDDDPYIEALITAATEQTQIGTGRQFVTATIEQSYETFPPGGVLGWESDSVFELRPPLQGVTSIKYIDPDGVEQTLSSSVYSVYTDREPGAVGLAYDQSRPSIRSQREAVKVRYTAGYGGPETVPEGIKPAIKLLVGHLYEHREAALMPGRGVQITTVPIGYDHLVNSWKVYNFR